MTQKQELKYKSLKLQLDEAIKIKNEYYSRTIIY